MRKMLRAAKPASSKSTADTKSRLGLPITPTRVDVNPEPTMLPIVPPAPIKPNSRVLCDVEKTSVMTDQNSDTANMLNIAVHTKKTRPAPVPVERLERASQERKAPG